tara:strand:- start:1109 stop:2818 length:1710 start_codon:yes stop_codon:yes gene_type:complete
MKKKPKIASNVNDIIFSEIDLKETTFNNKDVIYYSLDIVSDNSSNNSPINSPSNSDNSSFNLDDYDLNIDDLSDDLNDDLNIKNISIKDSSELSFNSPKKKLNNIEEEEDISELSDKSNKSDDSNEIILEEEESIIDDYKKIEKSDKSEEIKIDDDDDDELKMESIKCEDTKTKLNTGEFFKILNQNKTPSPKNTLLEKITEQIQKQENTISSVNLNITDEEQTKNNLIQVDSQQKNNDNIGEADIQENNNNELEVLNNEKNIEEDEKNIEEDQKNVEENEKNVEENEKNVEENEKNIEEDGEIVEEFPIIRPNEEDDDPTIEDINKKSVEDLKNIDTQEKVHIWKDLIDTNINDQSSYNYLQTETQSNNLINLINKDRLYKFYKLAEKNKKNIYGYIDNNKIQNCEPQITYKYEVHTKITNENIDPPGNYINIFMKKDLNVIKCVYLLNCNGYWTMEPLENFETFKNDENKQKILLIYFIILKILFCNKYYPFNDGNSIQKYRNLTKNINLNIINHINNNIKFKDYINSQLENVFKLDYNIDSIIKMIQENNINKCYGRILKLKYKYY